MTTQAKYTLVAGDDPPPVVDTRPGAYRDLQEAVGAAWEAIRFVDRVDVVDDRGVTVRTVSRHAGAGGQEW